MRPKPRGPIQMRMPGGRIACQALEDRRNAAAAVGEQLAQFAGHRHRVTFGAGRERRGLGKGRIERVDALPQRTGDLPHGDGAAVLGQRHLEVCAADVVAGCDGHWRLRTASLSAAPLLVGRVTRRARGGKQLWTSSRSSTCASAVAVAAVRGRRADYQPLVTPLGRRQRPGRHRARLRSAVYLSGALRRRPRRHRGQGTRQRPDGPARRGGARHAPVGRRWRARHARRRSASPRQRT